VVRRRPVALVLMLSAALPSAACTSGEPRARTPPTTTTVPVSVPDGPDWERRQGEAALALIRYPWTRLSYTVAFKAPTEGVIALNYPDRHHIDVFVRRDQPLLDLAHVVAHELGHAYDQNYNDDRVRAEWKAARGFPDRPGWLDAQGNSDFALPGGDYAEVFAYWAIGGRGLFKSELAPPPPPDQLAELAKRFFPER
jgi:hypothetical protein